MFAIGQRVVMHPGTCSGGCINDPNRSCKGKIGTVAPFTSYPSKDYRVNMWDGHCFFYEDELSPYNETEVEE